MTRVIQIVFALLVIVLGLAFHIKNDTPVSIDFYVRTMEIPLSWVVVVAFGIGAVLGLFVMTTTVLRLQSRVRRLTKKHEMATKEIVNLRAIPINDVT